MNTQATYNPETPIKMSSQAAGYLREDLTCLDHEESWVLFLNSANIPIIKKMMTVGTINSTMIDRRRIVKEALMCNSTGIILFHNHPSGVPTPSIADIKETEQLREACKFFDINLMDHIIVSDKSYYSFAEEAQIKF